MKLLVVFAFLTLCSLNAHAFAVSPTCEKEVGDVSDYMKAGMPADTPPEKIYLFLKIRDDLGDALTTEPAKADCLSKIYKAGMEEEAGYWAKRLPEGCEVDNSGNFQGQCDPKSEAVKSTKFLETLEGDLADESVALKQASDDVKAKDASGGPAGPACPSAVPLTPAQSLAQANDVLCCGTKDGGGGAVRGIEDKLSYTDCLAKTRPSKNSVGYGFAACAGNIIKSAAKTIYNSLTGIFTTAYQLWGARSQIWALITDPSALKKFGDKLNEMVQGLLQGGKDTGNALLNCYNGYERAQYTCKVVGDVVGLCASPTIFGQFVRIVGQPLAAAATALKDLMAGTKGGQTIIKGAAKVAAAATSATVAAKNTKAGRDAAAKARKAAELAKRAGSATGKYGRAALAGGKAAGQGAVATVKWLERTREFVNRHTRLTLLSEKIAKKLITERGYYKKLLAAAYRAEKAGKAARNDSVIAGALERAEPGPPVSRPSTNPPLTRGAPAKPVSLVGDRAQNTVVKTQSAGSAQAPNVAPEVTSSAATQTSVAGPGAKASVTMTPTELQSSQAYFDRFTEKVYKFSSSGSNERAALKTFRSATPYKIRLEVDAMHAQVDQLEAAGKFTPAKALSYHENIALAESEATKSGRAREWITPSRTRVSGAVEASTAQPAVSTPVTSPKTSLTRAGSKVLVQRANGGYVEGTVVRKASDGAVRVEWTQNGKTFNREIKPQNLRRSFALRDRVQFSTSSGQVTDATIVAKSDRAASVMWTEDGKTVVKSVPLTELRAVESDIEAEVPAVVKPVPAQVQPVSQSIKSVESPRDIEVVPAAPGSQTASITQPSDVVILTPTAPAQSSLGTLSTETGEQVLIPRTLGGYSEATFVANKADGTVSVTWIQRGKTMTKTLKRESLRPTFKVRDRVQFARPGGGFFEGTVTSKNSRVATIAYKDGIKNGITTVPLSELKAAELEAPTAIESAGPAGSDILSVRAPPAPQSVFTAPRKLIRDPASVEAKAETMLGRNLEPKEIEAVRKAHAICGEAGKSGVFSYPCRFRKTRACMTVLSREDCKLLLDNKVLGSFPAEKSLPTTVAQGTPLGELDAYLRAKDVTTHDLKIVDGKGLLSIGMFESRDTKLMAYFAKAVRAGQISSIETGEVVGPKVLRVLTRLKDLAPEAKPVLVKGEIDFSEIVPQREAEVSSSRYKSHARTWSKQDIADYDHSVAILKSEKACKDLYQATLEKCGLLNFTFDARHPENIEWSRPGAAVVENRNLDAEFNEVTDLDAWSNDFQTARSLRAEDREKIERTIEAALNDLSDGKSARRSIDAIKLLRMQISSRIEAVVIRPTDSAGPSPSTAYRVPDHQTLTALQPNTPSTDLASPGIATVTMKPDVVKFLKSQSEDRGLKFLRAIQKGFTAQRGSSGLVRYNVVTKNFVEVKVLSHGVKQRLIGCIHNGALELMSVFEKHGNDSANYSKYAHICD